MEFRIVGCMTDCADFFSSLLLFNESVNWQFQVAKKIIRNNF